MNVIPVALHVSELLRASPMAIEPEMELANAAGVIARAAAIASRANANFFMLPPWIALAGSCTLSFFASCLGEGTQEAGKLA
jgi:hypothetical protein